MAELPPFPRLVSLACHDLRTPLVTIGGFARTVPRVTPLNEQALRFLDLIAAAAAEMSDLVDELSRAARIESGRFSAEPEVVPAARVAAAAAELVGGGARVDVADGQVVSVNVDAAARALAALARAAARHGGGEPVALRVGGTTISLAPVGPQAAAVLSGAELTDLGAAVALRVLAAVGASVVFEDGTVSVILPSAAAATGAGL